MSPSPAGSRAIILNEITMNKVQGVGIAERWAYAAFLWLAMIGVKKGYYDAEMAAYLAGGALALVGSVRAFIINRPSALARDASNTAPNNSVVVITPTPAATHEEKKEMRALANAAGDKVISPAV